MLVPAVTRMEEMTVEETLDNLYTDPRKPSSLGGIERLFKAAKKIIPTIKKADVVKYLEGKFAYSQLKKIKRRFRKRKVIATDKNDVYQMDLADMQKFSQENDGFRYLLVIIVLPSLHASYRQKIKRHLKQSEVSVSCSKNMAYVQKYSVIMEKSSKTQKSKRF